jgi:hypothetical protein
LGKWELGCSNRRGACDPDSNGILTPLIIFGGAKFFPRFALLSNGQNAISDGQNAFEELDT